MKRCFPCNRIKTLVRVAVMATLQPPLLRVSAERRDGLFINEPWLRAGEGVNVCEGVREEWGGGVVVVGGAKGGGGGAAGLVRHPAALQM